MAYEGISPLKIGSGNILYRSRKPVIALFLTPISVSDSAKPVGVFSAEIRLRQHRKAGVCSFCFGLHLCQFREWNSHEVQCSADILLIEDIEAIAEWVGGKLDVAASIRINGFGKAPCFSAVEASAEGDVFSCGLAVAIGKEEPLFFIRRAAGYAGGKATGIMQGIVRLKGLPFAVPIGAICRAR